MYITELMQMSSDWIHIHNPGPQADRSPVGLRSACSLVGLTDGV